jgi:NAD(P)-dependent dehydrogenase (short-subunit alcohol dehydrogenase family)
MAYKGFDLTGKVALVTGGNGGIGLGMADALAEAGADICIWGTNPKKNEAATAQLKRHGRKVHAQIVDVGDEQQVEAGFAEVIKVMGHIDNCVANSGVSGRGKGAILEMTYEEWRRVLRVNLDGVFFTFRGAARHMVERGRGGSLVAMASTAAIEGAARSSHYGASKGGVTAMVRALSVELARYKISVNSVLPGWIETEMTANAFGNEKFAANVMPRIPQRRWGTGADFGPIAVYLASDAASYTTGRDFVIDGGYTLF